MDSFTYDDDIVRKFLFATVIWGLVGFLVGLVIALQLANPAFNASPLATFGRLRPLHTNAVIFTFAGNAFFTGAYWSTQRLLKARMFSDALSQVHFWGWQAIIVAAADVYLARGSLAPLLALERGARRTMHVIRLGMAFSLVYNVAGAALALTGTIDPLVAAIVMPVSSLTVVLTAWHGHTFTGAAA